MDRICGGPPSHPRRRSSSLQDDILVGYQSFGREDEGDGTLSPDMESPAIKPPGRRWVAARRAALVAVGCALVVGVWSFVSVDRPEVAVVPVKSAAGTPVNTATLPETTGNGQAAQQPGTAPVGENLSGEQPVLEGSIVVHVAGAVHSPGVIEAPAGSRVFEVLESAGGAIPEAELSAVNLAAVVQDGQQILIPRVGDTIPQPGAPATPGQPVPGEGGAASGPLINVNTAGVQELEELPRVGPVLAQRIVQWRTDHGPFTRPEDLDAVPGIGPAMLEALLPLVTV